MKKKCCFCGREIPKERLEILPETDECVNHSTARPIPTELVIPEEFIDDFNQEDMFDD